MTALKYCNEFSYLSVGVTNVVGSSVSYLTKCGCHMRAGSEIGVASTKGYTSQIIILVLLGCMIGSDFYDRREKMKKVEKLFFRTIFIFYS